MQVSMFYSTELSLFLQSTLSSELVDSSELVQQSLLINLMLANIIYSKYMPFFSLFFSCNTHTLIEV